MNLKNLLRLIIISIFTTNFAWAACPKSIREYNSDQLVKVLMQTAAKGQPGDIEDISVSSQISAITEGSTDLFLVQVTSKKLKQTVNGILKCDLSKNELGVRAYTWVSKKSSGASGGPLKN